MSKLSCRFTVLLFVLLFSFFSLPKSSIAGDKVYFYHNDHLGSPLAMTDVQGNVVWRRDYQPFGKEVDPCGATATNTHKYTGKEYDAETGLYYYGARYYDPTIGRFISVDPAGGKPEIPQTWNRYIYTLNNPYKYVDPDGEFLLSASIAAGFAVACFSDYANAPERANTPTFKSQNSLAFAGKTAATELGGRVIGKWVGKLLGKASKGAADAPIEFTKSGERFVRVGNKPENLKFTFKTPGGTQEGTYAFPEETFNSIGRDPAKLKYLGDLPGAEPNYYRVLKPPSGTPIQRGIVPGGEFGGQGGVSEVKFPEGF